VSLSTSVVAIDEAQFFKGLRPFVERALAARKHVILAGLDGDYRQQVGIFARQNHPVLTVFPQVFGELLSVIPLADRVDKLTALCMVCADGTEGPFSKRLTSETCQELVGDETCYKAVCREHLFSV
jgi:thymidine kinase